jgi:NAD-dependent deacetylase
MSKKRRNVVPNLYVISGAGLSAESGLTTYRDGGVWSQYDMSKVCNYLTYSKNRINVFEFYNKLLNQYVTASPNAAHEICANWQNRWGAERVHLLTQNVDDLLERAGAPKVIHLHGDLNSYYCPACGRRWARSDHHFDVDLRCQCGCLAKVKPGVVFFNESAPNYGYLHEMGYEFVPDQDIMVWVGTSLQVVRPHDILSARQYKSRYSYYVDPGSENGDTFRHHIQLPASAGLKSIEQEIIERMDMQLL